MRMVARVVQRVHDVIVARSRRSRAARHSQPTDDGARRRRGAHLQVPDVVKLQTWNEFEIKLVNRNPARSAKNKTIEDCDGKSIERTVSQSSRRGVQ